MHISVTLEMLVKIEFDNQYPWQQEYIFNLHFKENICTLKENISSLWFFVCIPQ
jgi:hypothetical protein